MRKILGVALLASPFVGILAIGAISGRLIETIVSFGIALGVIAVIVAGTALLEDE